MAVRSIIRYPNAALATAAEPVSRFDESLRQLAHDLIDTMRAAPGIGITAPHIGILQRLTVIETDPQAGPRSFVNPEILWQSADSTRHSEGSVSMPGIAEEVERPARVRVRFQTLEGKTHEEEAAGLMAVCLQHEIDQLDGIFWIRRLSRLKRERAIKRFEKLD
ncbi:peptide deformylase [Sinorhizobium medicae]|uniref:peptide deformylase n=1 Tax=Sinorhizobium medicae TaxID=110321 RepID=UPI000C7C7F70|nr:peptide deformylase [Sinorhizobium medicae]MBO1939932.1 peptide deformylase [Sinorhizobium medicae]MDX0510868.1 peptide deformylase [Sinorhizobium medicae]MDX0529331.1 peptide deformylase [Sinorhizobium medicae]MDX0561752.1 peptide deformylase [Sinorhizobium medicae]MDX0870456.1 peptide deformylase [Sinorhizobium medicae]